MLLDRFTTNTRTALELTRGTLMTASVGNTSWDQDATISLPREIEDLLQGFHGIHPLKKLFWELLGYDRRDEAVSLSGMRPDLRSHVIEARNFASHDQFHLYHLTLTTDSLTRPLIAEMYRYFRHKHCFVSLLVGNVNHSRWYLAYQPDDIRSPESAPRVSTIPLGDQEENLRIQSRALAKLRTYGEDDEPLSLLELTSAYDGVFASKKQSGTKDTRAKDGIALLLTEIGQYRLLTAHEERAILEQLVTVSAQVKIHVGNRVKEKRVALDGRESQFQELRRKLIVHNLRLCFHLAKKYAINQEELLDLFQESVLGLHRAVDLVDPGRNLRFSTYAFQWVRQAITRWIVNNRQLIRLPAHLYELPRSKRPRVTVVSITGHGSERCWELVDESCTSTESNLGRDELRKVITESLRTLNQRYASVLVLRFGLNGSKEHTLEEVGRSFDVTRERIRQIEEKALNQLRTRLPNRIKDTD